MSGRSRTVFVAGTSRRRGLDHVKKAEVQKIVNKAIRRIGESHHFDVTATRTPTSGAATIDKLTAVPQGDTDITRTADRLEPRHLRISFSIDGDTSFTNDNEYVRVLVVKGKRDDATDAPAITSVLESTTVWAPYNWDDKKDFPVLYDRLFKLSKSALRDDHAKIGMITIKSDKLSKIQFDNAATTGTNHLYLFVMTTEATNGPQIRYYSRLIFKDL